MNRILSYLILSVSIFWALPSCIEAGDDDGIIEDEYRELEIIDRTLLPQIMSQEWLLKGAGFTKPVIYENNFYFEDKAEMPLKSIKGDNDNGLTFTFTKNIPATFATLQYEEPGGYTEEKFNKSSYEFSCDWHTITGLTFKARYPKVTEILYFPNNSMGLQQTYIKYYGKDENHVTKLLTESYCSHIPGTQIIDGGVLYMVFELK